MQHAKALLMDLAISCLLHYSTNAFLKNNSSVFLLTQLWFTAGVKWVSLRCFLLGSWKDASVRRCVAVTCLMCPVYESGLALLMNTQPENWSGSLSCPGKTITSAAATLLACLFWEVSFPDTKRKAESSECAETKQRNRELFMRVVRYSKPDAPLLSGAFVFLALAVICKYGLRERLCKQTFQIKFKTVNAFLLFVF